MNALQKRDRKSSFTISQLVEASGVPASTIHHYLRLGLIPPAHKVARNRFVYDERHLHALAVVRRLRERKVGLEAMAGLLAEVHDPRQAFRPQMWDQAAKRLLRSSSANPSAKMVAAATDAFAQLGYEAVSLHDVAAKAGLSKSAVYRHFASKDELFLAAVAAAVAQVVDRFEDACGSVARVDLDEAAKLAAKELAPYAGILLDLVNGVLRSTPGYKEAARRAIGTLAYRIGVRSSGDGPDIERGERVLAAALERSVRAALSDD